MKEKKVFFFDSYGGNDIYGNENWRQFLTKKRNKNGVDLQQLDSDIRVDYCVY